MLTEWKLRRLFKKKTKGKPVKLHKDEVGLMIQYKVLADSDFTKIKQEQTNKLLKQATSYAIDVSDDWFSVHEVGGHKYRILRDENLKKLTYLVRQKSRESIEWWIRIIVTVLAALTGLLGAIIGLLAIQSK